MTPTGKNFSGSSNTFANRCSQEVKINSFLSLQSNKKTTKRFDTESRRASKVSASIIEMYLRIRPTSTTLQKSYAVLNSRTLLTFLPFEDKFIRNSRCAKSSETKGRRHAFTKIFGSETSQAEMFEGSIKHRVAEFLGGKSSTIMTYGTRDSGKTYTLFGTSASPGIITRSIELVFSAINCTIAPWYKPTFQDIVLCLNETARASEMQRKTRVLDGLSTDVKQTEARKFLENSRPGYADPDECEECYSESMHAVWLSLAEIYNGNVYDLLDDAETHSPLRLYVNAQGRAYVCGLQKVHAITALEACQILMAGQSRMRTALTESKSSRLHTIFTMELLKYQKDHAAEEVILSTLTFCDLAGSTQFEKSHMREASNINNSLLVLGRCLKAVSQNQKAPFRQSKLTRICQRALSGEENLSVIVNVVFRPGLTDETQSIFNFCDIVRKLLNNYHKECKQLCEFEETVRSVETCDRDFMTTPSSHQSSSETAEMSGCTDSVACRNIREQNRRLERELETVKSDTLNCEYAIRQELADYYSRIIENLEATYKENTKKLETEGHDLLKWSVKQVESFYKDRIDDLRYKKRKRRDSGDYIEDNHMLYEELKAENVQVTSKVIVLKEEVKKLKKENKTILCEKNNCSFQLALVTEELKKFRQLTRAAIRKWDGNSKNIKDDADCLMNNLEELMNEKVKKAEKKLEEMSEYICAMENRNAETTSGAKQESLKSEDLLNDTSIKMKELEEELLRKEACIIRLQHDAQLQERQLAEIQQRLTDTKNENISDRKCKCDRSTNISFDDYTADSFSQDNMSLERTSSRMCMNSPAIEQHKFNDWIIVPTLFASHVESTKKNKLSIMSNVDCKSHESSGSTDCRVSRSSDRSSKDDSGVSSELQNESQRSTSISDRTSIRENEDKPSQICIIDKNNQMEENVEQLKIDDSDSIKWDYEEVIKLRVAELSQDLETIRDVIYELNETACVNECQLLYKEGALERLTEEKSEIAIKCDDLFKVIENKMQEYKCEIRELIRKLAVKEESKSRISKWLERYIEKSRAFENKLSLMRNRLDKAFSKCANEHLPKIESLEEEVLQKTLQINELDGKIAKMEHEFAKGYELFQKIHDFEIIVNRCQRDKNELCRRLYECSETQLTLEDKLKKLTMKSEIISLKNEIRNITDLNIANSKKARNLSEQTTEAGESINSAKEDLHCCEDLRENVENTMKAEIHDFRSRFSDRKNNTTLLKEICKTYGDSQDEITRLKLQLEHKELEVTLLKTNRDTTIKKYEILIRHFQDKIEEKEKYLKTIANNSNNSERSLTENQRQPEETFRDHEAERSFTSSFCFVPEHASSEALNVSLAPSEDSIIFYDEKDSFSIKFDNNESCQTDSSVKSNVRSSETDRSEMEGNFNMRSPSTKDTKEILDWMKVRRISGKTAFSRLSAKHTDINSDSESE